MFRAGRTDLMLCAIVRTTALLKRALRFVSRGAINSIGWCRFHWFLFLESGLWGKYESTCFVLQSHFHFCCFNHDGIGTFHPSIHPSIRNLRQHANNCFHAAVLLSSFLLLQSRQGLEEFYLSSCTVCATSIGQCWQPTTVGNRVRTCNTRKGQQENGAEAPDPGEPTSKCRISMSFCPILLIFGPVVKLVRAYVRHTQTGHSLSGLHRSTYVRTK